MIIFAIYAVGVWYLAMRWRRRWLGFASVLLGTAFLFLVAKTYARIDLILSGGEAERGMYSSVGNILIYGEAVLVLVFGLFIAALPRHTPSDSACPICHYELGGLDPVDLDCPECGEPWRGKGSRFAPPEPPLTPIPQGPPRRRVHL